MKPIKARTTTILATLLLAMLGGCSALAENHPTVESRYMTPAEQAYWSDRQSRHEKAEYWSSELRRQSGERLARYFY